MCNCIEEVNATLAASGRNTKLSQAITFRPPGSSLMIETEVIEKKRGSRPVVAFASYCPFCGEKYGVPAREEERA